MTDARIPDRWMAQRRFRQLNDSEFRSYILALVWSVAERTEGRITPEDLPYIVDFGADAVATFVATGLWRTVRNGWVIADFDESQTTSADLVAVDAKRAADRERKRLKRAEEREALTGTDDAVHADVQRTSGGTSNGTSNGTSEGRSEASPRAVAKAKDKAKDKEHEHAREKTKTLWPEPVTANGSAHGSGERYVPTAAEQRATAQWMIDGYDQ